MMTKMTQKETAEEIRKYLKREHPATKFSVRMSPATEYIYVSYENGPAEYELNKELAQFCDMRFDGMTDSYVPTGVGEQYSCVGVLIRRTYSAKATASAEGQIRVTSEGTPFAIGEDGRQYSSLAYGFDSMKCDVVRQILVNTSF